MIRKLAVAMVATAALAMAKQSGRNRSEVRALPTAQAG